VTPTANDRIVDAAHQLLRGELAEPRRSGLCLQLVRVVIERAYGLPSHDWYRRWRTITVWRSPGSDRDPWARDMEASLRDARKDLPLPRTGPAGDPARYVDLAAPDLLPGDLLFRWDTARNAAGDFVGHVGILMPGGLVLENVSPTYRAGALSRGPTVLSRLGAWPVTTAVRFTPE
jgi:hypothetical protein